MRTIKFRAWDKQLERFRWFDLLTAGNFVSRLDSDVQQFTGLKDKNGKEIYEGDILQETNINQHGTFKMVFKFPDYETFSGGGVDYGIEGIGYSWDDVAPDPRECEVIGNIYENPELLSQEN